MDWFKHLFWLVGKMYQGLLSGDSIQAAESWYWIRVHLNYDHRSQGGFRNTIENILTVVFGVVGTLWLIILLYSLTKIIG